MSNLTQQSQPPQVAVDQIIGLYNQDKLEQTVSLAENLAKQYPNALILYDILGAAYMGLKNADKTIASYQKALKLNPNHTDAYNNIGMALYDQGRFDEAVRNYQKAVRLEPSFADALYNLGNALKQTGDLRQAIESYKASLTINPNDAEVLLNYGTALKSYGDFDKAIEAYVVTLKIDPNSVAAQTNMDNVIEEKAQIDKLVADYARITKLEIESAEIVSFTGTLLKARGYPEAAMESYNQALKIKPDYADAYYNMGVVLKDKGDLNAAIDSYKQAIKIKPDYVDAYYNMGNALQVKGDLDAAIDSYKQALKIKPDYADAYYNMGVVLNDKGELDAAIDSYKQAIKIKPDYAEAYSNMGKVQQNRGYTDPALSSYNAAHKIFTSEFLETSNRNIVALLTFGRSGSMFLHSLFDGHPEIATIPGFPFMYFFNEKSWQLLKPNFINPAWRQNLVNSAVDLLGHFMLKDDNTVFDKTSVNQSLEATLGLFNMGERQDQFLKVDQNTFQNIFLELLKKEKKIDRFLCFSLIHEAFNITCKSSTDQKMVKASTIFHHMHIAEPAEMIPFLAGYPNCKQIYIVREPVMSLESWMLVTIHRGKGLDNLERLAWNFDCMLGALTTPFNRADSWGIRLEDLKLKPERTMSKLIEVLGISDHHSLSKSEFGGLKYWGPDSPLTGKISGFDKSAIQLKRGRLFGARDIIIFKTLFWPFSNLFDYPCVSKSEFKNNLEIIRPWLDEPLEFEINLYDPEKNGQVLIEKISSSKILHRSLITAWNLLMNDRTYKGMMRPIKIE